MRNLILCTACLLAAGTAAAPAMATQAATAAAVNQVAAVTGGAACDARYYGYLVGKGLDEARSVDGTNYRVLAAGAARGDANPKRMTIVYDARSNRITEVGCG